MPRSALARMSEPSEAPVFSGASEDAARSVVSVLADPLPDDAQASAVPDTADIADVADGRAGASTARSTPSHHAEGRVFSFPGHGRTREHSAAIDVQALLGVVPCAMEEKPVYRILALDADTSSLSSYRDILCLESENPALLQAAVQRGSTWQPTSQQKAGIRLDTFTDPHEAVAAVKKALAENDPYAVAVVDVHVGNAMASASGGQNSGSEGIRVAEKIRTIDPDVEILVTTINAATVSLEELNNRLHPAEKFLYLQKPFRSQELRQLADSLCAKWVAGERYKDLSTVLWDTVEARTAKLHEANEQLRRDFEARQKLEEQLRLAQKMEALGTLAGGIAHDFNNILGVIMGYAEMIQESVQQDPKLVRRVDAIVTASRRARDLVSQILDFSRQAPRERKPLRATPLIKETVRMLRSGLPATVDIREEYASNDDSILADPTQIHQVILNLCTNAAQAMGIDGGELFVATADEYLRPEDSPAFSSLAVGNYLRLTVRDTGPGIENETLSRIFDPFYTTKKPGEGTGMGLAVVHGVVKSHDGTIVVESEPGKGASFHVYLPKTALDEEPMVPDQQQISSGKGRVLFVEDELSLAELGEEMLEALGYEVDMRTSAVEALEAFRHRLNDFDLVITDQNMPNMTGMELSSRILALRPDIPIVLCTGFSENVTPERARKAGIREYLHKPILKRQLAQCLDGILGEQ